MGGRRQPAGRVRRIGRCRRDVRRPDGVCSLEPEVFRREGERKGLCWAEGCVGGMPWQREKGNPSGIWT